MIRHPDCRKGLIFRGETIYLAIAVTVLMFVLLFYLTGVAYFRALRYRLSRTYWRGIRGGSDDPGFQYGLSYMWKKHRRLAPDFPDGAVVDDFAVERTLERDELWPAPIFRDRRVETADEALFAVLPRAFSGVRRGRHIRGLLWPHREGSLTRLGGTGMAIGGILLIVAVLAMYIMLPLAALAFYSKYFRLAVGGLRLHNLEFEFRARAPDWILFFLANMAIVICTLGIGYIFMPYRNWKFFVDHMEAYGEINVDELTQSETIVSKHGEGLLDAFDVGAI